MGAHQAVASGVVNAINSYHDSHPWNPPCSPEVTPSPTNSHHQPLKQILLSYLGKQRQGHPNGEGQLWRPKLEPAGSTPDTHHVPKLPPPRSWQGQPAHWHRGEGGTEGRSAHSTCESVSPQRHQCDKESEGDSPAHYEGARLKTGYSLLRG